VGIGKDRSRRAAPRELSYCAKIKLPLRKRVSLNGKRGSKGSAGLRPTWQENTESSGKKKKARRGLKIRRKGGKKGSKNSLV